MKTTTILLLCVLGFIATASAAAATAGAATAGGETIKIERKLTFAKASPDNVLEIYNIFGSLEVEGYDGNEIIVYLEITINAKTEAQLSKAKGELSLGVLEDDSALVLYNKAPFLHTERIDGPCQCNWMKDVDYDFSYDYKVKVPRNTHLHLSTINDGFIDVKQVNGNVYAHHVNGPITLLQVGGSIDAKTINGDLSVEHTRVPVGANSYHSFNGDVNVYYPSEPNAEISFKSFNGSFFTDLDNIAVQAPTWEKEELKKNGKTTYKLSQQKKMTVGKGGNLLAFETFNGNIYVKKSK
jgi:hypothetical protein